MSFWSFVFTHNWIVQTSTLSKPGHICWWLINLETFPDIYTVLFKCWWPFKAHLHSKSHSLIRTRAQTFMQHTLSLYSFSFRLCDAFFLCRTHEGEYSKGSVGFSVQPRDTNTLTATATDWTSRRLLYLLGRRCSQEPLTPFTNPPLTETLCIWS